MLQGCVCLTFSIIALGRGPGEVGVATATGSTCVADRVPHVRPGVGAVATQGFTRVSYGPEGLELMSSGLTPTEALELLLSRDPDRELRQVGMMDVRGRSAVHTGRLTPRWHGHVVGEGYLILGNLITGPEVLEAMEEAFWSRRDEGLGLSLLAALTAGAEAGGDLRGERSAALLLVLPGGEVLELRVDDHPRPVEALWHLWELRTGSRAA